MGSADVLSSDGHPVKDDEHHITSEGQLGACYLVLTGVTVVESGQYMCYATNPAGNASTLANIMIDGMFLRNGYYRHAFLVFACISIHMSCLCTTVQKFGITKN